mmetsp:Transcript_9178/g.24026  ORF Transcript_9178/g.24026 Transcript_9178/m.24026 type:complete len:491 (-) Transcript_9178:6-1478(-)
MALPTVHCASAAAEPGPRSHISAKVLAHYKCGALELLPALRRFAEAPVDLVAPSSLPSICCAVRENDALRCSEDARAEAVRLAEAAERVGRTDEMLQHMFFVARLGLELTTTERRLLAASCKAAVTPLREAILKLASAEKECGGGGDFVQRRRDASTDLRSLCDAAIEVSEQQLELATGCEGRVFCLTMIADYNRYLAWFEGGDVRDRATPRAKQLYEQATLEAAELPNASPLRVSVALNSSVFSYDILKMREEAIETARAALLEVPENPCDEIVSIVKVLRNNLEAWCSETEAEAIKPKANNEDEGAPSLVIQCWSRAGETDIERIKRAMQVFIERLQEAGVPLPGNIQLTSKGLDKGHDRGCFTHRFGTRQIHVTTRESSGGRLSLVVRSGGGFIDFVEFVRRYGRVEHLHLERYLKANRKRAIQLNCVRANGSVQVREDGSRHYGNAPRTAPARACGHTPRPPPCPRPRTTQTPHARRVTSLRCSSS